MTLALPNPASPPFTLVALAVLQNIPLQWDLDKTDASQVSYNGVTGVDAVRAELEKNTPGKEIPLPPLPTVFEPTSSFQDVNAIFDVLDDYLAYRTYFAGPRFGFGDSVVWGSIRSNIPAVGAIKKPGRPHLARWWAHVEALPVCKSALEAVTDAKKKAEQAKKQKRTESVEVVLPNAVPGKVVVRFAPEPSGYLHIGHLKAAILNRFLADQYQGTYILRFDDTNPLKEEGEFEETIQEDLKMIDITYDKITHTSDNFDKIIAYTEQLIKQGDLFMDDTDSETVKEQRRAVIPSKNRDATIEQNLARFHELLTGSEQGRKWSGRAKIDYQHKNGTMRDPVVFRYVEGAHHITGTKYKAYPTYDLACPIIDHIEGVTHALRANEYAAREEQYQWFLQRLGFPKIEIFDFSRIDFVYTVLSKRKLKYLVEQGVAKGWDDPRFPTVRGIRSRGMTVKGLKDYIIGQGASQATMQLEWDGIWTVNKRVIDPVAPRYWAINEDKIVKVEVKGRDTDEVVAESRPLHKKNPEVGNKDLVFSSHLYIEQEDAASFGDNEEVTFMDWGNAFISSKQTNPDGSVSTATITLHLEGDFKKTSKKVTWLAQPTDKHPLVPVTLIEYDYLITKKKLEEDDDLNDVINPKTEYRTPALASAEVASLKKWDIIQFERKGFYICQGTKDAEGRLEFGFIPDGRLATVTLKAEETKSKPKAPGAVKGSWGKAAPKQAAVVAGAGGENEVAGDFKTILSDGTSGFEIPISKRMFDAARVYGAEAVKPDTSAVNMFKVEPIYKQ